MYILIAVNVFSFFLSCQNSIELLNERIVFLEPWYRSYFHYRAVRDLSESEIKVSEENLKLLRESLFDENDLVRRFAAVGLGKHIHEDNCGPLEERLKVERTSRVQREILKAIHNNDCCCALETVKQVAISSSLARNEAMLAISGCGEEGFVILLEFMESTIIDLREWASTTISDHYTDDLERLIPLLSSDNADYRELALRTMSRCPVEKFRPFIEHILKLENDQDKYVRRAVERLLKLCEESIEK